MVVGLVAMLLVAPAVAAQDADGEEKIRERFDQERFSLSIEGFFPAYDTQLALNRSSLGFDSLIDLGTRIDLEDRLGLDDRQSSVRVQATYRWGRRHRVQFSYLDISRSGEATIEGDYRLFDRPFSVLLELQTTMGVKLLVFDWGYALLSTQKSEFGLVAGLYTFDTGLEIEATARLAATNAEQVIADGREDADPIIPLPVVGLFGGYRPTPRLGIGGHLKIFALEFEEYSGNLLDVEAWVEYIVWKHLAVGLSISSFDLGAEAKSSDEPAFATFDWERRGISMYLRFRFGGLE